MNEPWTEWLAQADYDMDTAEYMLQGGRCFYAVFLCRLSIEKAIKGLYQYRVRETPPKSHNLIALLGKTGDELPEPLYKFLLRLNEASVATRYPEDIAQLLKVYDRNSVLTILTQAKEVLQWTKQKF